MTNITATDPEDDGNAAVSVVVNAIGKNLKTTGQCVALLSGF